MSREGCNRKLTALSMIPVLENQLHNLSNLPSLVRRSIDIVDWNRPREGTSGETLLSDIVSINELTSGYTIYKSIERALASRVDSLNGDGYG